ncbi:MAG: hypothetical protein PUF72_02900 [Clostridiales bacterium]|nr:hypothetical protein [Clostridiales bacterium]
MAGILNKGINLSYATTEDGIYTVIKSMQEYPDLGGTPEQIETTSFDDENKTYIAGLPDYGTLEYTFLDDSGTTDSSYEALLKNEDKDLFWKHTIPVAGGKNKVYAFPGQGHLIEKGAAPNGALQYGLSITVTGSATKSIETKST